MKIKTDFITNSSSTSFIIQADTVDFDYLKDVILKELYLKLKRQYFDEFEMTDEEIYEEFKTQDILTEDDCNIWLRKDKDENGNDVYIIDNNTRIRFDWEIVDDVMDTFNLLYKLGYCD